MQKLQCMRITHDVRTLYNKIYVICLICYNINVKGTMMRYDITLPFERQCKGTCLFCKATDLTLRQSYKMSLQIVKLFRSYSFCIRSKNHIVNYQRKDRKHSSNKDNKYSLLFSSSSSTNTNANKCKMDKSCVISLVNANASVKMFSLYICCKTQLHLLHYRNVKRR